MVCGIVRAILVWWHVHTMLDGKRPRAFSPCSLILKILFLVCDIRLQFELSDSDTLVFVSHGDFLGELFGRLLGNDSVSFSLMNTSISSLKFPQAGGGCILEFVNRTGHLTEQRNVQLYQSMEIKEKRSRSGKRYVDIGALMRTQKYFDSPMGLLAAKL